VNSRPRKWIVRSLLTLAAVVLAAGSLIAFVVGTESGTRWVLEKVSAFAPVEIEGHNASGTLLTGLEIPLVRYADADRVITIRNVHIVFDWLRTSLTEIAVKELTVHQFEILNIGEKQSGPEAADASTASLPIGIRADSVSLASLKYDDVIIEAIHVKNIAFVGNEIEATFVAAEIETYSIAINGRMSGETNGLRDLDVTVETPIARASVTGDIEWLPELSVDLLLETDNLDPSLITPIATGAIGMKVHITATSVDNFVADVLSVSGVWNEQPAVGHGRISREFDAWQCAGCLVTVGANRIELDGALRAGNLSGHIDLDAPSLDQLWPGLAGSIEGAGRLSGSLALPRLGGDLSGNDLAFADWRIDALEVRSGGSTLENVEVDIELVGLEIDPSLITPIATGAIGTKVQITATSVDNFVADVLSVSGVWNEQPAVGHGRISREFDAWQCAGCLVTVGANRIELDGALRAGKLSGDIDLDAPSLDQLWPSLAGSIEGAGRMSGSLALPRLGGDLSGKNLGFADWRIDALEVHSGGSTLENVEVAIELVGLENGNTIYGSGQLQLAGDPSSVNVTAEWTLDEFMAEAGIQLSIEDDRVDGLLRSASLKEPYSGTWSLDEAVEFQYATDLLNVGLGTWINEDAQLSHQQIQITDKRISINAALTNGPLAALSVMLPEKIQIDGYIDATVSVEQSDGKWSGSIEWQQRGTSLLLEPGSVDEYLMQVPVAGATIRLKDNALELQSILSANPGIEATLNASLTNFSSDASLDARLQLNGSEWDWISRFFPDIDDVEGAVTADIRASGIVSSPDLSGEFRWQRGHLAMPALNLPLSDIDVTLTGSSDESMILSGEAISGGGPLTVNGRVEDVMSKSPSFTAMITGDHADLLNWPDYQLTASPNLTFAGNTAGVVVTGKVSLDSAEIKVDELPEDAVSPSDDVKVEGREAIRKDRTRISGEVEIELSDDIHIQAFGLDSNLEGQLRFVVPGNDEPQAHGEVRLIGGVFEAYGQRLQIERGTMIFTGPLDNPIMNVRATRKIDSTTGSVTAGINLTGRAQNLSSTIFSDPSMSEADALSYLILGRPLENATSADGSNLSNTAYSLGLRQAALISNQIGQTVGLDELTVAGDNQNTTELVAGKQINSNLYARYAYGVFTQLGHLLLRYRLSDSFVIEVGAGETQSMDILYTIERK